MTNGGSANRTITRNRVWKSLFRQDYPDNEEGRSRIMVDNLFLHIHPARVKIHSLKLTYTWGLGVITSILFLILGATGIYLTFFYVPSTQQAYQSIQSLQTSVDFGILIRSVHRWAAHLMVVTVFLHMCRVFFTGGYKHPREFNWVIGVVLWIFTLLMSYTGYLLPWDQLAYWASTVGTNLAGSIPFIGDKVKLLVLGAAEVGQPALIRFYAFHIALIPTIMTVFIGIHLWKIRKDGGLSSPDERTEA
jgi:quinol-cytochrome oxidoreductase complex cytochrome b subunit